MGERSMNKEDPDSVLKSGAKFRLFNVSGYTTELLELGAEDPKFHVLFIPGNPGVVFFYKDFLESLFQFLDGTASITAIGHTGHTKKNWDPGRLFSLQEQIDHKVDFIRSELQNTEVPIVLSVHECKCLTICISMKVGHSIGSYIAIETFRRSQDKVKYCTALYPFLMFNPKTSWQLILQKISESSILSATLGSLVASFKMLPNYALKLIMLKCFGSSWSTIAVDTICSHLLQYHTIRNVLFMSKTEFRELSVEPDWSLMRENRDKLAFLFGVDDEWGPLEMFEEILKQVPGIEISVEREGHTHNFSCTTAGAIWVALHVSSLIKSRML